MKEDSIDNILNALNRSAFRRRFHLSSKELSYIEEKGISKIEEHAHDFIRKRLGDSYPLKDGKQTPMRGHPVFLAQHATATCCRGCLSKWHHIPPGRELTKEEENYIVEIIMRWIRREITHAKVCGTR